MSSSEDESTSGSSSESEEELEAFEPVYCPGWLSVGRWRVAGLRSDPPLGGRCVSLRSLLPPLRVLRVGWLL
jgi:hypothetical protein